MQKGKYTLNDCHLSWIMIRQKPRPHAGTVLICVLLAVTKFQEHTGRRWRALHGTSTPCGSHRSPFLPATAHIVEANFAHSASASGESCVSLRYFSSPHKVCGLYRVPDASTLGRKGKRIIVLICGSWPQACHSLLCARRLLPLYLLPHVGIMASSPPHGFPLGPHIKRIQ